MAGKQGSEVASSSGILGERLRSARKALGLSQAQLAGTELTKGFISQLESGTVRPSVRSLQVIAGRLGKPLDYFLGDEPLASGKRIAFHRIAGETATLERDWDAVRLHAKRGLAEAAPGRDRASLLHLEAQAEIARRGYERTFDLVTEALAQIDVSTDPQLVAALLFVRGSAYGETGQLLAATEALEASRDVMERHEVLDPRLRSRCMVALGTAYRRLKRGSKAMASYQQALATASHGSDLAVAARGYMGLAATHYDSGELDAAIANYRRALELFQRVSDIEFELNALQSIATVELENGDPAGAKTSAEHTMRRALEVANAHWAAVAEVILARVALKEGQAENSLRMARHAERILAETDDRVQHADSQGAIGAAAEALGRPAEADAAYRASIEMYTSVGDLADRAGMAGEYARALRARGEVDAAFDMLELANGNVSVPH